MTRDTTGNPPTPIVVGRKRGDIDSISYKPKSDDGPGVVVGLVGHILEYTVDIATGDNGPYVTELRISSPDNRPITTDDLRSIPLRRLAMGVANAQRITDHPTEPWPSLNEGTASRKRHINDELLREVAERARSAFRNGARVREDLAEYFHVSAFTVDKWLAKAREAGYLQPGELSHHRK